MTEKIKSYLGKLKETLKKVSKKVYIVGAVALVLIAAVITIVLNNRPYAVLFTGLSGEETSTIMNYLEEQGVVDYRLENNDTILVPKAQESNLKAKLLMEGYPKSGFSYSTYYDHVSSLSTEAERNAAYLMALQDRMGAVIRCFEGVKEATVTIAQGEDRAYVLDSGNVIEGSASVMVAMHDGRKLTNQQAAAIRNLVARGVQGLEIDSVTIADNLGNLYSAGDGSGVGSDASELKLQLEEENNNKIRTNIMQVLVPLFGEDNVRVGVNCTVDVNRTIENSTTVTLPSWAAEGEGIIGSKVYENSIIRDDGTAAGGVVGTETNSDLSTYVEQETKPDGTEREIHTSGQVDYDNPRSETHVERTAGYITDCMVSVSINSTTAGTIDVQLIREHVARAAGISDESAVGKISILPMAFYKPNSVLPVGPSGIPEWVIYAAAAGVLLFVLLLVVILLVRKKRRKKENVTEQQAVDELFASVAMPQREPVGADVMSLQTEKSMELRKDIRRFADENPEIAAQMVKNWLRGGDDDA